MKIADLIEGGVAHTKDDRSVDHQWAQVKAELDPEYKSDPKFMKVAKAVVDRLVDYSSDPFKTLMRTTHGSRSKALELFKAGLKQDFVKDNEKLIEQAFDVVLAIFNGNTEVEWHSE